MTEAQALQLVCKAALLEDSAATWFLCEQLERQPAGGAGKLQLLLGLAWFAPEKALVYNEADTSRETRKHRQSYEVAHRSIKRLQEAHRVRAMSAEEQLAYLALTALLPPDSFEAQEMQLVQQLVRLLAPRALEKLDPVGIGLGNPLLLARLWQSHAALLFQLPGVFDRDWFFSVGQLALAARGSSSDIAIVRALVQRRCRSLENSCTDSEAQALIYTLGALEALPKEKLISLLLDVLKVIRLTRKKSGTQLMAEVLVLIARAGLEADKTLLPLLMQLTRLHIADESWQWKAQVENHIASLHSVPPTAYTLVRLLYDREAV